MPGPPHVRFVGVESPARRHADTVEMRPPDQDLWAEVDDLAARTDASPFVRRGWVEAWLRAFGGAERLQLVTVRRGPELVAAIPMLRPRRGVLASPTNWHTPAFGPIASDAAAAGALASGLVERTPSLLDIAFIDPRTEFTHALTAAARGSRRILLQRTVLRSPYVPLTGDFTQYEQGLSSKFKRETRRRRRKLEELGDVSITFTDGGDQLDHLLNEGFAVEGSGWKTHEGTAIVSSAETDAFYRDVADWARSNGWLRLGFLCLAQASVAFQLSLLHDGAVHVVKVGFDPDFRRYAPGTQLTWAAIARAFEQGMRRYEFLGDADPYKLDWTDAICERVRVQLFGRSPYGLRAYATKRWARPLAQAVGRRLG